MKNNASNILLIEHLLCSRASYVLGGGDILVNKIKMFSFLEFAFRLKENTNILLAEIISGVWLLSGVQLFHAPHAKLLCLRDSPGRNTGVGCHFLLQGIIPTQGSNPCLLLSKQIPYHRASWETQDYSPCELRIIKKQEKKAESEREGDDCSLPSGGEETLVNEGVLCILGGKGLQVLGGAGDVW